MEHNRFLFEPRTSSKDLKWLDRQLDLHAPPDPIFDSEGLDAEFLEFPRRKRRRRSFARVLAVTVVASAAQIACGGPSPKTIIASDAIAIQLAPGAAPPRARADDSGPPIVPLARVSDDEEGTVLRMPIPPGVDPATAASDAASAPGVAFAEPITVYRASRTPNDPRFRDLWGLSKIGAPVAWTRTTGSADVTVAVVDDGVALDHPDLQDNLWTNPGEIAGNGVDDDGDGIADDVHGADFVDNDGDPSPATSGEERWHGSHVSGTIGAGGDNKLGVAGVNWHVSLMAVRALGPAGGRSDDLARAIDYASSHGARVINASWGGGGTSQVIAKAIGRAAKRGTLFVAAAGNESASSPSFPANVDGANVISVGATTPDDLLAPFSNRGAMVAAPGVGILSTTSPGQYERYDGTSMAAPHVSGLAALLWAAHPEARLEQVRKAIVSSAVAMTDVGHGRIDAVRALSALDDESPGDKGTLQLSREKLTFSVRTGRVPRAQVVSLRSDGGARRAWTATVDVPWIVLSRDHGDTPARVSVHVDPAHLRSAAEGHVQFHDKDGNGPALTVEVHQTDKSTLDILGEGCALRDGVLHASLGSGCTMRTADGEAPSVTWTLPGGARMNGARLDSQFVRRGQFRILVSSDEGEVDDVPVVVE